MLRNLTKLFCALCFLNATTHSNSLHAQFQMDSDQLDEIEQQLGVQFTGNQIQDAQIYEQAKSNLLQNDPTHYAQIFGAPNSINGYQMIPGFNYTGDSSVDDINYKQAKIDLYTNNRIMYDQLFPSRPNARERMSQLEYSNLPNDKRNHVDSIGVFFIDGM